MVKPYATLSIALLFPLCLAACAPAPDRDGEPICGCTDPLGFYLGLSKPDNGYTEPFSHFFRGSGLTNYGIYRWIADLEQTESYPITVALTYALVAQEEEAVDPLIRSLNDQRLREGTRQDIARCLFLIGTPEALKACAKYYAAFISDMDYVVSWCPGDPMYFGPRRIYHPRIRFLRDKNDKNSYEDFVLSNACGTLSHFGKASIPCVVKYLSSDDKFLRVSADWVIREIINDMSEKRQGLPYKAIDLTDDGSRLIQLLKETGLPVEEEPAEKSDRHAEIKRRLQSYYGKGLDLQRFRDAKGSDHDYFVLAYHGWRISRERELGMGHDSPGGDTWLLHYMAERASPHLSFLAKKLKDDIFVAEILEASPLAKQHEEKLKETRWLWEKQKVWLDILGEKKPE